MQSDVFVSGKSIKGTLKYLPNGITETGTLSGAGNFLALKFNADNWAGFTSVKVGLDPSIETGLVELINDPDKNGVFKISSNTQKFKVVATNGTATRTDTYDLSELTLNKK